MATVEPPTDARSLRTQLMAIDLAADVQRLNALDDTWTGYLLAEPDRTTVERDLRDLSALTGEMMELLEKVALGAGSLREVVEAMPDDLDAQLGHALHDVPFGDALAEIVPEPPFAKQVSEACSIVVAEADAETEALRAQFNRLVEAGYTPGDIGPRMKCAILLVGAGASLVGLLLTQAAPVPGMALGAAGILLATVVSANGWSCKRAGDPATASA